MIRELKNKTAAGGGGVPGSENMKGQEGSMQRDGGGSACINGS